jgi:hypothetical protein
MIKAVVKNGVIVPCDPLPENWQEGTEVEVDKSLCPPGAGDELDHWFAELQAIAAEGDPEDDRRLEEALREIRPREKELARTEMELLE